MADAAGRRSGALFWERHETLDSEPAEVKSSFRLGNRKQSINALE